MQLCFVFPTPEEEFRVAIEVARKQGQSDRKMASEKVAGYRNRQQRDFGHLLKQAEEATTVQ